MYRGRERENRIHFRRSYSKQNLEVEKEKKKKKNVPPNMGANPKKLHQKKPMPTLTLLPCH